MNDKPKLKPCPFCGATALRKEIPPTRGRKLSMFMLYCPDDKHMVYLSRQTKKAAIKAWNTRAILGNVRPEQIRIDEESIRGRRPTAPPERSEK